MQGRAFSFVEYIMPKKTTENPEAERVADRLSLKDIAKDSFIQLCNLGCDPHFLAEYLPFITPKSKEVIRRESVKGNDQVISLRGLDAYNTALEGFDKRDLEALIEQILKMAKKLDKLNRTRLVSYLDNGKYNTDIHEIPPLLMYYGKEFLPLLIKEYERVGDQQHPQFTEYLNALCAHVKLKTGKPRDRLLAEVLTGAGVNMDEFALKTWRSRNKEKR